MRFGLGSLVWLLCSMCGLCETSAAFQDVEVGAIVRHQIPSEGRPGIWMAIDRDITMDGAGNFSSFEHIVARSFDPEWGRAKFSPFIRSYWSEHQSVRVIRARVWKGPNDFEELPRDAVRFRQAAAAESIDAYKALREIVVEFPPLAPGATVEIHLEMAERVRPGELNSRWFENFWGDEEAVIEQQLELILPSAMEPSIETLGGSVSTFTKKLGGFVSRNWITGNLLPTSAVVHGPTSRVAIAGLPDSARTTVFSTTSWEFASRYLGRFWNARADSTTTDISVFVGKVLSSSPDALARARALEQHVQGIRTLPVPHQVIGLIPLPAVDVFSAETAAPRDKALLLVALCRAAGLDARPYMVRTRGGAWSPEVACPDQFDRFLLSVRLPNGNEIWCDPLESRSALPAGQAFLIRSTIEEVEVGAALIEFPGRASAE